MKNFFFFLFILLVVSFSARSQNKLLWYTFSSASSTVLDESGNGNNGTLVGGAFVAGNGVLRIGLSNTDYLDVPAAVINGLNDFTIEMKDVGTKKFYHQSTDPMNTVFSSSNAGCTYCFGLAYNQPDSAWQVTMSGVLHSFPWISPKEYKLQHVKVTLIRENGVVTLYVDETEVGSFNDASPINASTFIFGQHEQCLGGCFEKQQALVGGINELRIWDAAVELKQLNDHTTGSSLEVFPNPASSSTTISFFIEEDSPVTIELFDLAGRKIETVLNENLSAGSHEVQFHRGQLPAGIYFLRIKTPSLIATEPITIQ